MRTFLSALCLIQLQKLLRSLVALLLENNRPSLPILPGQSALHETPYWWVFFS
jgi:hypothetical protein